MASTSEYGKIFSDYHGLLEDSIALNHCGDKNFIMGGLKKGSNETSQSFGLGKSGILIMFFEVDGMPEFLSATAPNVIDQKLLRTNLEKVGFTFENSEEEKNHFNAQIKDKCAY